MVEVWKKIEDFEDYEASNTGKIRKKNSKLILSQRLAKGKATVCVRTTAGKKTAREVGKLVLTAFRGYRPTAIYMAEHLDGNPENNALENLKWQCRSQHTGKVIFLRKNRKKHEFRTLQNAGKFLGIGSDVTFSDVEEAAVNQGYSFNMRDDRIVYANEIPDYNEDEFLEWSSEPLGISPYDEKHTSSPEVKQQIRNEIDKFVDYCDTHYSTCNEIANKGIISKIDETDPVVIKFRTFLKEHDV